MVIELTGVKIWSEIMRVILNARVRFEHEVQLPLYYSHFEIVEFGQYQYFFDLVAGLLKSGNKKVFTSHFVFGTEVMQKRVKMV